MKEPETPVCSCSLPTPLDVATDGFPAVRSALAPAAHQIELLDSWQSGRVTGVKATLAELLTEAERSLSEARKTRRAIWSRSSSYYWQSRGEEGALAKVVKALQRRLREVSRGGGTVLSEGSK